MRKGPDGKTIRPDSPPRDGSTRKVAKRSILDRMASADEDLEATRLTGANGPPTPPRNRTSDATIYSDAPTPPDRRAGAPTSAPDRTGTPTSAPDRTGAPTSAPDRTGTPTSSPDRTGAPTSAPDRTGTDRTGAPTGTGRPVGVSAPGGANASQGASASDGSDAQNATEAPAHSGPATGGGKAAGADDSNLTGDPDMTAAPARAGSLEPTAAPERTEAPLGSSLRPRVPGGSERNSMSRDPNVTQVYRPRSQAAAGDGEPGEPQTGGGGGGGSRIGTIDDPVVGWLVVIEGPGRGAALPIGYGNNRIGRSETEDIIMDFGDPQISRENHALITYDGKHRRFYIQQGAGRNLTHVNDELVMVPVEMKGGETVSMGETKVRFVAFCGADFDWYDA